MIRPEVWVLSTLLEMHGGSDGFIEGVVEAYERLGLLSGEEANRWRERFIDLERDEPRPEPDPSTRAKAEAFLAELIGQLTPMRREMEEAAIARNAACDAAVWALYRVGALDDDDLQRWLRAAWSKLTPWRDQPPAFAAEPRPFALEAPVWAPPDNAEQAAQDAARAAKAAMTARIDRVLTGGPERQDGLAIVALVVHAEATSLHFHYLDRPAAQIAPFEQHLSRQAPDEALAPLTPPTLHDNTGLIYQPTSQQPDPAGNAWVPPYRANDRESISGYWLYTPAAPSHAHTFTIERGGHRWTLRDTSAGPREGG